MAMTEDHFNQLLRDIVDEPSTDILPNLTELTADQADVLMDTVYMDHLLRNVDWSAIIDDTSDSEAGSKEAATGRSKQALVE